MKAKSVIAMISKRKMFSTVPRLLLFSALLPGLAHARTILLSNAVVHTVSGPTLPQGQVLVENGKIRQVAATITGSADEVVDLKGQHLYPGLINPASSLGLAEIALARPTLDIKEVGDFTPDVQAWLSVNPDSELLSVARANGTTHALVLPMGQSISGQSGLIQLYGWSIEHMAVKSPVAMHLFWPDMTLDTTPKDEARDKEKWKSLADQAKARRLRLKEIEDFIEEAEFYARGSHRDEEKVPAWEAMLPYVRGDLPFVVHADDARQINAALKWAQRHHYKIILAGGRDAWRVAAELATRKIPVIYDQVYNDGNTSTAGPIRDTEPYDVNFRAPAILAEAGVKIALGEGLGSDAASNARNLPYAAAQAVAHGLPREQAIKALTLYPAEMLGVSDRIGSISLGREATLFACTGDILDIRSKVTQVWIAGEQIPLANRQSRLYERYRSRPRP